MGKEQIQFEPMALDMLAKAANGSMRDSLSLLDQAINYSQENVDVDSVASMLGVVDHRVVLKLIRLLLEKNIQGIFEETHNIMLSGKSGISVLNNLAELFFCVQSYQISGHVPMEIIAESEVQEMAKLIHPEYCQLLYQIAIKSKDDILLAPDEKIGLDMALLRMIAFSPNGCNVVSPEKTVSQAHQLSAPLLDQKIEAPKRTVVVNEAPPEANSTEDNPQSEGLNWNALVARINLKGVPKQIIRHSLLQSYDNKSVTISLDPVYQSMLTEQTQKRIQAELSASLGKEIDLIIAGLEGQPSKKKELTPAQVEHNEEQKLLDDAYNQLKNNEIIQQICKGFNVEIDKEQIFLKK